MILQELNKLYDRLKDDPVYDIPAVGYSLQKISFVVVLNPDGTLFDIQDARVQDGKKMIPRILLVPGKTKPSGSGLNPCILWDNASYLLGFFAAKNPEKPTAAEAKKLARAPLAFAESKKAHLALREKIPAPQFQAVANFLENWNPDSISETLKTKLDEVSQNFGVFKICGETRFVHEIPEIAEALLRQSAAAGTESGAGTMCLISGVREPPAELHEPTIKGVAGAQTSGAMIVSFNQAAFTSYGKEKGGNAPTSKAAVNRYCNALNALLRNPKHRFQLGETTVVFWTGTKTKTEDLIAALLNLPDLPGEDADEPAQDEKTRQEIFAFLENLRDAGTPKTALEKSGIDDDAGTPFFMLGLSPNAARIAVRFWHAGTLGDFLENLRAHHRAMRIQRRDEKFRDPEFIPLWRILRQTARDADGIPPQLGGALLRAVIEGGNYPLALIQLVLNRIRTETKVDYIRASVMKAFLTKNKKQNIAMSLDTSLTNPAYLLGRLFAVLEKAQSEAIEGVNAGIRERFYSSASETPRTVFPLLLRTFPHWLAKNARKHEHFFNKIAREIIAGIDAGTGFPARLNLDDQGLFALGYYHQMQSFFTKKETTDEENGVPAE